MKRLLLFLAAIIAVQAVTQQQAQLLNLRDSWVFEKAEYMERSSALQNYQVKYTIGDVESLHAYSYCFQNLVKSVSFISENEAVVETLFKRHAGEYYLMQLNSDSGKSQTIMHFGNIENIGKKSSITGVEFNAPDITYLLEVIDEDTIAMTMEGLCTENNITKDIAIRCILKKD